MIAWMKRLAVAWLIVLALVMTAAAAPRLVPVTNTGRVTMFAESGLEDEARSLATITDAALIYDYWTGPASAPILRWTFETVPDGTPQPLHLAPHGA